jgi:hypothetical protein
MFLGIPAYSCTVIIFIRAWHILVYSCVFVHILVNCSFVIISSLVVFDIHHLHYHFDFLWLRLKAVDALNKVNY